LVKQKTNIVAVAVVVVVVAAEATTAKAPGFADLNQCDLNH